MLAYITSLLLLPLFLLIDIQFLFGNAFCLQGTTSKCPQWPLARRCRKIDVHLPESCGVQVHVGCSIYVYLPRYLANIYQISCTNIYITWDKVYHDLYRYMASCFQSSTATDNDSQQRIQSSHAYCANLLNHGWCRSYQPPISFKTLPQKD